MRDVPPELAALIESGAASLCHVWILARTDGQRFGFTDHDRDLQFGDLTCVAASGWTSGASETAIGLSSGSAVAAGALDSAAITEADIEAGLYDGADVELWRVDWTQPDARVRVWSAQLAKIRREGETFIADLVGPLAKLDRVVGRLLGRSCDARLGDDRCGVNLAALPGAVCDKRFKTCVATFANGANFQGFPDIPGDDFLTATPIEGGRNDGGSRR